VFENGVLRKPFRPSGDEIIGGYIKLHNEELRNLYPPLNITGIIKSRKM
jgi:hypothetical protein